MKRVVVGILGTLAPLLVLLGAFAWYSDWCVRAERAERLRGYPGDELIPNPIGSVTHAVTIGRPADRVWPWLAQMGSGRAGWYAYDFIDNGGLPSADRILPELQNVSVGTIFPWLPGAKDGFVLAQCQPQRSLVLAWRLPDGSYRVTWAFVLEQPEPTRTRLIVHGRVAPGYAPLGLPEWFGKLTAPWAHAIMERKQMLGIKRRAEAAP